MRRGCVLLGLGVGASRRGEGRKACGRSIFFCKIVRSLYACPNTIRTRHRGPHTASSRPEQIGVSARARPWQHTDTATLSCGFFLFACAALNTASCHVEAATLVTLLLSARARMHGFNRFSCCMRSRCEVEEQVSKKCCSCCCWVLFSKRSGQTNIGNRRWDGMEATGIGREAALEKRGLEWITLACSAAADEHKEGISPRSNK